MRILKYSVAVAILISASPRVFSQDGYPQPSVLHPFSDPAFQDYVETAYGYKSPANMARLAPDFRDSLTSLPASRKPQLTGRGISASAPLTPEKRVFISILLKSADRAGLIESLGRAGFKFSGERTSFSGAKKKTFLLGWAPRSKLRLIRRHAGVRRVSVESGTAPYFSN